MNLAAVIHEPKSVLSYAYDQDTLHIRIKTPKDEVDKITLRAVDPFNWAPTEEDPCIYEFETDSIVDIAMKKEYTTEFHDIWFAPITGFVWHRIRYAFLLEGEGECFLAGCHGFLDMKETPKEQDNVYHYYNFPYISPEDVYEAPQWVKDTVWYQIFPDRFCKGENGEKHENEEMWGTTETHGYDKKYGGNLAGIIEKLDYIRELGITGIYFTPLFSSPSAHKYDTSDYERIDTDFGDNETFGRLVEEAHKRGLKIMLDAVFNHCGYYHPFWQDVLKKGKDSKYFQCFYILDADKELLSETQEDRLGVPVKRSQLNYRTFAFEPKMPKWNTGHPLVREYLLQASVYWVSEYHIDAWRLDVSNEVSHDFWRDFRKRIKGINKEVYILGENWDNSYPWICGDQFDAVMNYEFMTPVWNFLGTNGEKRIAYSAIQFKNAMSELMVSYPQNVFQNMFNLLDSHDTARIMTVCGEQTKIVRLAYVLLLTFAGSPSIYYGSEIGLSGTEQTNRKCMEWDENNSSNSLKAHIKKLIQIRKNYKSCKAVEIEWLYANDDNNCIIYKKTAQEEQVVVIINNSSKEAVINLPEELQYREFIDIYDEKTSILQEELRLSPFGFLLLLQTGG